jgi:hypothetical protein
MLDIYTNSYFPTRAFPPKFNLFSLPFLEQIRDRDIYYFLGAPVKILLSSVLLMGR